MPSRRKSLVFCALSLPFVLGGCASFGPSKLRVDQVDYSRALGDAKKREILATMVGLRFADAPAFLTVSNIISGYSISAGGNSSAALARPGGANYGLGFTGAYSNNPTFTFTPTTGEAYAAAYIRPLSPTLVLPLADGGIPIDLLLRITAQSIGGLQNGSMLGGPNGSGTPEFFELLRVLRRLQLGGELTVQYREVNKVGHVALVLGANGGAKESNAEDVAQVRHLLGLSDQTSEYDIVNGQQSATDKIPMVTRSVLAIMSDLGAEIAVPDAEIVKGGTKPTITLVGGEERPTIIVKGGASAPADAYVQVNYRGNDYWIDQHDFDSKYAFTVVQDVMALAEVSDDTKGPIVTIPAY